jgi:hypothetical protein
MYKYKKIKKKTGIPPQTSSYSLEQMLNEKPGPDPGFAESRSNADPNLDRNFFNKNLKALMPNP